VTLTEPLLSPDRRQRVETAFADLASSRPRWLVNWAAGVLADIAGTLPRYDPWTRLSGRLGRLTVGLEPPANDGACHAGGQPFGTWSDGADLVALVFERPEIDAAFAALADPLDPMASGLVAFAGHGPSWSDVLPAVVEAWRLTTGADLPDAHTATRADPEAVRAWLEQLTGAIRWLAWRRRAYGVGQVDLWPHEACVRWSSYASEAAADRPLDEEAISAAISDEAVLLAPEPADRPPSKADSPEPQ
jgi:hypothetical protein